MTAILPRTPAPALEVETLDHGSWRLSERTPETFTLVVVYRGLHCPICKSYLKALDGKLKDLAEAGVDTLAVSSDGRDRAETARRDWGLESLTVGYGLSVDAARRWGLFVSNAIKDAEPDQFVEPGLFLIDPKGMLFAASIQTMPFARPSFDDVLGAVRYVVKNNYPARGEA
ncbi:MAG: redoxin domain-containing protein [Inquilinaceae bacterium]